MGVHQGVCLNIQRVGAILKRADDSKNVFGASDFGIHNLYS